MVNQNVQGPVQLAGRGFIYRGNKDYQPGEYSKLVNMNVQTSGSLRLRPPVQGHTHSHTVHIDRLIGNFGSWTIATESTVGSDPHLYISKDHEVITPDVENYSNMYTNLDNITSAVAGTRIDKHIQFLGYFVYNNLEHLITFYSFRIDDVDPDEDDWFGFLVVQRAPLINFFEPAAVSTYTVPGDLIASPTGPDIPGYESEDVWFPSFFVRDWVIHKDRLWIAVGDILYFSQATDLTKFAVPNGGFFRLEGRNIRSVEALGDIIYAVCDEGIVAITYDTDPNTDSQVTLISDTASAENSCIYGDTVYVVNANEIMAVNGNTVSKIMDLYLGLNYTNNLVMQTTGGPTDGRLFDIKVEAFEDALYIQPRTIVNKEADTHPFNSTYAPLWADLNVPEFSPCYRVDLATGAVTQYDFLNNGSAVDIYFNGTQDRFNQQKLIFLTSNIVNPDTRVFHVAGRQRFFSDVSSHIGVVIDNVSEFGVDTSSNSTGTDLVVTPILPHIKIEGFSPDTLRYFIKKFRSIMLDADLPTSWNGFEYGPVVQLKVYAGVDNTVDMTAILEEILPSAEVPAQIPTTYRYGVNQRCRQIDIEILPVDTDPTPLALTEFPNNSDGEERIQAPLFELSDIRTLWGYSGRGPTNYSLDNS